MWRISRSLAHKDIITASVGDLIPQITSSLSREYFHHTYIFINDKSNLTLVHHTKTTDVAKALEAKEAYEREICKYSKDTKYYYTDNSIYAY